MKASDQIKTIRTNFDVTNHRFINAIAMGVKEKLEQIVPETKFKIGGKSLDGTVIKLQISGTKITKDADELDKVKNDVRQTMDSLKNPANLMSILDY